MITDPKELLSILALELPAHIPPHFKLRVPRGFVDRMEKGNPTDPLLLQVLPLHEELAETAGFVSDPLSEKQFNPVSGLLHKYHGRVLIPLTGSCAINCRFCFRREFDYAENNPGKKGWDKIFDYTQQDTTITEIILSGGDPLIAPNSTLKLFIKKISAISHIKTLRIHTRIPIVSPERIDKEFCEILKNVSLRKIMVLHCNHPNELDNTVRKSLKKLQKSNITLLNQSVLLKNINNNPETLIQLSEKLFDFGVLPYYLHLLDKVKGTAHFDVSEKQAKEIMKKMQERLPGYLVPKLVREIAGEKHKTLL